MFTFTVKIDVKVENAPRRGAELTENKLLLHAHSEAFLEAAVGAEATCVDIDFAHTVKQTLSFLANNHKHTIDMQKTTSP